MDDKVSVPTLNGAVEVSPGENAEKLATKKPRGFAAIDKSVLSEIARKGGKAAHAAGTAHEFTPAEARLAGRKGGAATHAKRRAASEGSG